MSALPTYKKDWHKILRGRRRQLEYELPDEVWIFLLKILVAKDPRGVFGVLTVFRLTSKHFASIANAYTKYMQITIPNNVGQRNLAFFQGRVLMVEPFTARDHRRHDAFVTFSHADARFELSAPLSANRGERRGTLLNIQNNGERISALTLSRIPAVADVATQRQLVATLTRCTGTSSLSIVDSPVLTHVQIGEFMRAQPGIKNLKIASCDLVGSISVDVFGEGTSGLDSFTVADCELFSLHLPVNPRAEATPSTIRKIEISRCAAFDAAGFNALAVCRNLEQLTIAACGRLGAVSPDMSPLNTASELKVLSVTMCPLFDVDTTSAEKEKLRVYRHTENVNEMHRKLANARRRDVRTKETQAIVAGILAEIAQMEKDDREAVYRYDRRPVQGLLPLRANGVSRLELAFCRRLSTRGILFLLRATRPEILILSDLPLVEQKALDAIFGVQGMRELYITRMNSFRFVAHVFEVGLRNPTVSILSVVECRGFFAGDLLGIARVCPNITSLRLVHCPDLFGDTLPHAAEQYLKELKRFEYVDNGTEDTDTTTSEMVAHFILRAPLLTHLTLRFLRTGPVRIDLNRIRTSVVVDGLVAKQIAERGSNLVVLVLDEPNAIRKEVMVELVARLPKLDNESRARLLAQHIRTGTRDRDYLPPY